MGKKYWIGVCDESETKPTNYETYLVLNEDELQDAQHDIAVWIADDFMGVYDE